MCGTVRSDIIVYPCLPRHVVFYISRSLSFSLSVCLSLSLSLSVFVLSPYLPIYPFFLYPCSQVGALVQSRLPLLNMRKKSVRGCDGVVRASLASV